MVKIEIRTIHDVIRTLGAKRVLAISERLDLKEVWEDRILVSRLQRRKEEDAFLAQLQKDDIHVTSMGQKELKEESHIIRKKGAFDLAIVMGENPNLNVSVVTEIKKYGFKKPIYLEITQAAATSRNNRDIKAAITAAEKIASPQLLRNLVYLTKVRPTPRAIEVEVDFPAKEEPTIIAVPRKSKKPASTEFIQEPSDLVAPPGKMATIITRVIRDTKISRSLKKRYDFKCQVCDVSIGRRPEPLYIEAHHIKPLGGKHLGKDTQDNMLVLCPNHHAMFDYGIPRFLSSDTIQIHGKFCPLTLKHQLSLAVIEYHNAKLFRSA